MIVSQNDAGRQRVRVLRFWDDYYKSQDLKSCGSDQVGGDDNDDSSHRGDAW